jgi:Holliday junction resolvase
MPANYAIGVRSEYAIKALFESKGYFVIRSAGSKTPCDLLAIKFEAKHYLDFRYVKEIRFIQVKSQRAKRQQGIVCKYKEKGIEYWYHYRRARSV